MSTDCESSGSRCASCHSGRSHGERSTRRGSKFVPQWKFIENQNNDDVVDRFIRKLGLSQKRAEDLFMDVKRFLWIHSLAEDPVSPPPKVDNGWHEFILFTEDYANFCENLLGGFVHHRPNRRTDPPDDGSSVLRTKELLQKHFPDQVSSDNWKFPEKQGSSNCSSECKDQPCT